MQMLWTLLLLIHITTAFEQNTSQNETFGRIANGVVYNPEDYPYVVQLFMAKGTCTGSLISPLFVLTAAHCTYKTKRSEIRVIRRESISSQSYDYRKVKKIYQHPKYRQNYHVSDISLIKLQKPFDNVLRFLVLSGHPSKFSKDTDLSCVIIGFGLTEDLNSKDGSKGYIADVSANVGQEACKFSDPRLLAQNLYVCAKPDKQMICPGDSGGPLICRGFQYGIANHGFNFKDPTDNSKIECGSYDIQTRHLFIYAYRDWISNILKNNGKPLRQHHKFNIILIMLIFCSIL